MLRLAKLITALGLFAIPFSSQAEDACDSRFNYTAGLSCVSCGIEKATGQVPSEKFLALLGFAAQHYYAGLNPYEKNVSSEEAKVNFQRHLIQQVQAYGFCLGVKIDAAGVPTNKTGYGKVAIRAQDLVYPSITGSRSRVKDGDYRTGLNSKQMKELIKQFGFKDEADVRNIFQDDRWRSSTPAERQKNFRTNAEKPLIFSSSEDGEGLKNCFEQLKQLHTKDTIFNLKTVRTDNQEFCKTIAAECEIKNDFCSGSVADSPSATSGSGKRSLFDSTKSKNAGGAQ